MIPAFGHRDPDARGYYGEYGGRFVPETLMAPVAELEKAYLAAREDEGFRRELEHLLRHYVGRATPLYEARRLSASLGGARIFLKREDLAHTGAHKINNALGQALLARRMGKRRIIAETGAGQHGVATATVCALLGLTCDVYMGAEDMERQSLNVFRMQLLGATVRRVDAGSPHAQGRDQRGDARLGDQRRRQLLPARFRAGSASVPADGARVPVGHRPRSARTDPRGRRPAAGRDRRLRRRRQQRDGDLRRLRRRCVRETDRRRGGRTRHPSRPARGAIRRRQLRRAARHAQLRAPGRRRQHRADAFDLGRPRLRRGRSRACLAARHRTRRVRVDWRRRGAGGLSAAGAGRRDPAGAGVVACDRLRLPARPGDGPGGHPARQPVGPRRQGRPERREGAQAVAGHTGSVAR